MNGPIKWWRQRQERERVHAELEAELLRQFKHGLFVRTYPLSWNNKNRVELPMEVTATLRDVRQTMADLRVLAEIAARAVEPMIPEDQLPDNLKARRRKRETGQ